MSGHRIHSPSFTGLFKTGSGEQETFSSDSAAELLFTKMIRLDKGTAMKRKPRTTEERKRVSITVNAEPWDKLRILTKEIGWRDNWFGLEVDRMVAGMLVVAEQAKKDAEEQKKMTEAEAKKRYESLMRVVLEGK
jgi:hypothetical protein